MLRRRWTSDTVVLPSAGLAWSLIGTHAVICALIVITSDYARTYGLLISLACIGVAVSMLPRFAHATWLPRLRVAIALVLGVGIGLMLQRGF